MLIALDGVIVGVGGAEAGPVTREWSAVLAFELLADGEHEVQVLVPQWRPKQRAPRAALATAASEPLEGGGPTRRSAERFRAARWPRRGRGLVLTQA